MAKQVCDIKENHGMTRGQSNEHLRDYKVTDPDAKKYGFYDPTRVHLNFEVTKGGIVAPVNKSYPIDQRFQDICNKRGIKIPEPIKFKDGSTKNRILLADIILGGSRAQMLKLAFGDQHIDLSKGADNSNITRKEDIEKWAVDQYKLMCKLYGEENIVAFIVHLDEKNPHVHLTLLPEVEGKISYKKLFVGKDKEEARQKFLYLHDVIAAVNAKWGLDRGDNIKQTGAKHRSTEEYMLWLRDACNELEQKKDGLSDSVSGLQESLKLLEGEIRKNEIKVKGLTTMINNKMIVLHDLEQEQEQAEASLLTSEYNKQEVERQKKNLETLIASNQDFLDKKRKELDETKELLELLKKQHAEKLQQLKETDKELTEKQYKLRDINNEYINEINKTLLSEIGNFIIYAFQNNFWKDAKDLRSKLPLEDRITFDNIFNKALIPDLTEHGDEILRTALALFLGKEGEAIEIASSAGGGGVSGGWRGKKDDEDDDLFTKRCFATAVHMIKHGGRKKGIHM